LINFYPRPPLTNIWCELHSVKFIVLVFNCLNPILVFSSPPMWFQISSSFFSVRFPSPVSLRPHPPQPFGCSSKITTPFSREIIRLLMEYFFSSNPPAPYCLFVLRLPSRSSLLRSESPEHPLNEVGACNLCWVRDVYLSFEGFKVRSFSAQKRRKLFS